MAKVGWAFLARNPEVSRLRALVEYLRAVEDHHETGGEFVFGLDTRSPEYQFELIASWPGAKVVPIEWTDDFSAARNQVIEKVESPWTFALDPDELPSHDLLTVVRDASRAELTGSNRSYAFWFRNFFGGDNLRVPPLNSDYHIRMWQTGHGKYYRAIHELVAIDGKPENRTRGTHLVRKIDKSAFVIHAKPRDLLEKDSATYAEMSKRVGIRSVM